MKIQNTLAKRSLQTLAAAFVLAMTVACSSVDVAHYQSVEPKFDLFEFFSGDLKASGIVRTRSGKVTRYFNADIRAYIKDDVLYLDEVFEFNDGEVDKRLWEISRVADNRFRGVANDIVGEAEGASSGNALRWAYSMVLTVNGRNIQVDFDDWIFQTSEDTLINVTDIKKWGFKVGEVVLVISK